MARFDLSEAQEGESVLDVRSAVLNLPPGFVVEGIFPALLSIRLVRRRAAALRLDSEFLALPFSNSRENHPEISGFPRADAPSGARGHRAVVLRA